jgi:hypothetical protein
MWFISCNIQHLAQQQDQQKIKVNAPKENLSPIWAGNSGQLTKHCTQQHCQANKGKCGLEARRVRALEALHSLRSKKKLAAENRQ